MRLFVALDLPAEVRDALRDLLARLQPKSRGARWVRPQGMHVTLKFIGEADPQRLDPILAALASVHSHQPVEIHFRGIGFFPNERRPRVIWCGVQASPNLAPLAAAVDRALAPLGFAPEARDFVPHLTLARFKSGDGVGNLVCAAEAMASYDFGSALETEFHLFQSFLNPAGAEYKRLGTFPIVEGSP